jgi:hypothetical protein
MQRVLATAVFEHDTISSHRLHAFTCSQLLDYGSVDQLFADFWNKKKEAF